MPLLCPAGARLQVQELKMHLINPCILRGGIGSVCLQGPGLTGLWLGLTLGTCVAQRVWEKATSAFLFNSRQMRAGRQPSQWTLDPLGDAGFLGKPQATGKKMLFKLLQISEKFSSIFTKQKLHV